MPCARYCAGAGDAGRQCEQDSSFKDPDIWPHTETASTLAIKGQTDNAPEVLTGQ